jgi:hypothetical protein
MRLICTAIAFLFLAVAAEANPVEFDTHTYNLALLGGGGGESGVFGSDLSVETFCDNFDDIRWQPSWFLSIKPIKEAMPPTMGSRLVIWDILDPARSPAAPTYANAGEALEEAAEWYAHPNANKSFLADFLIVSDSTMSWSGFHFRLPASAGVGDEIVEGVTVRNG